ncbi:MAG: tetratricopeptide repeat protein [Chitinophagales bacterium]|nr:tetratricopeptide repeat protein [Chitinophagales bacterium]
MLFLGFIFLLLFFCEDSSAQPTAAVAENYFAQQQFDSALSVYNQLIQEYPDTLSLYFNRGLCYYKLNQPAKAGADFNYVLAQDSLNKEALYLKALALEQNGEQEAAIKTFEKLFAIDENYNDVAKRIKNYRLAVYLSRNWYYMIAMALLVIIFLATVVTLKASRRV